MIIVNESSLDMRNISLPRKIKNAIKHLKHNGGYKSFVLKMNGDLIVFEYSDNKQRYTRKTLKPHQFTVLQGSRVY